VGVSVPLGVSEDPAAPFDPASLFTPAVNLAADAAILTAPELDLLAENITAADLADLSDADGLNFGTGSITSEFVFGGGFSLDGVHPTATGYAVIANGFIDAINAQFSAGLQRVDPNGFTRIFFEFPAETDFSIASTP